MKTIFWPATVAGLLGALICFQGLAAAVIDTVPVGNTGNLPDDTGFGAVEYSYRIGTYEVTNARYVEFLNAVDPGGANALSLYSSNMASNANGGIMAVDAAVHGAKYVVKLGRAHHPANYVSWYDAIRFANWLHNGQGAGDTETGAYNLRGGTPTPSNGTTIVRNADARWFLPSENEWYKAAYHKNDGVTGNYWDYPTSSDREPYSDHPPGSDAPERTGTANFFKDDSISNYYDSGYAVTGSPVFDATQNYLTDVGAFEFSSSPYGTFDQAGNVWEWNEDGAILRGARGGFWSARLFNLLASNRSVLEPHGEWNDVGFRVASVPEPSSFVLIVGLLMGMGPWSPLYREWRRLSSI